MLRTRLQTDRQADKDTRLQTDRQADKDTHRVKQTGLNMNPYAHRQVMEQRTTLQNHSQRYRTIDKIQNHKQRYRTPYKD